MVDQPVIKLEDVCLNQPDGLVYGPLNLVLNPGEGALIIGQDLGLLRYLMRCCQGAKHPDQGQISWWDGRGPGSDQFWPLYDFYRQIGLVDRQSQLLSGLTLLDNFLLMSSYARQEDGFEKALLVLDCLGLMEYEYVLTGDLPEPQRRLALYALALAREPRLLLIERPIQFLDREFDLVWHLIKQQASETQLAYLVFDRSRGAYSPEEFQTSAILSPHKN